LKYNKKIPKVTELLELKPVSLSVERSRLWWFGHIEHKDDADLKIEFEEARQTERPRKT